MSWTVQSERIAENGAKWELAERLTSDTTVPEDKLGEVFANAMHQLEVATTTNYDDSLRSRVWDRVSQEHLKMLRATYTQAYCINILGRISDEEAVQILDEHKRTGEVQDEILGPFLHLTFSLTEAALIEAIEKKARSIALGWKPNISEAIRQERLE